VTLTPLIDVVFILLIFFMLATAFIEERRIALSGPPMSADDAEQPIQFYLGRGAVRLAGVTMTLAEAAARAAVDDRPVIVETAPDISVQRLAEALATLRDAGARSVAVAASETPP
jgi:biopolymer transport protein ExbD